MKKLIRRVIPAALAFSLAAAPVAAYADAAEEFVPGPDQRYDNATMERLQDNVLEYDEIEMLVEEYNQTLKSVRETYSSTRNDYENVAKIKEQIYEASGSIAEAASDMMSGAEQAREYGQYSTYGSLLYSAELMSVQAEQVLLQADSSTLTTVTPDMLRLQLVDTTRATLISAAQSAMIGYEQLLLQKESLNDSIELLQEVYKSTGTQAALGLATETEVTNARQNLEAVQAQLITIDANETQLRQTLCNLLGWPHDAQPEIQEVPEPDLARIDRMDPAVDKEAAIANNYTLQYNKLSYAEMNNGSVEQENMARTIEEQTATISSSVVNLYNAVLQRQSEYQTAVAALELEKTKMDAAERKMAVGTIGRLEYLQQKNAYSTQETAVETAKLNLFQAMETYDWALKGNLSLS